MAAPSATFIGAGSGPESRRSPRISELWKIVGGSGGSSDGDTVAITTRYMKKPALLIGAASYAISGQTVTATLITALADAEVIAVEIVGLP